MDYDRHDADSAGGRARRLSGLRPEVDMLRAESAPGRFALARVLIRQRLQNLYCCGRDFSLAVAALLRQGASKT